MYAFGLEECGDYKSALKHGEIALNLNKYDCWATHAITHCYEMRSNYTLGINFLESTINDWSVRFKLIYYTTKHFFAATLKNLN